MCSGFELKISAHTYDLYMYDLCIRTLVVIVRLGTSIIIDTYMYYMY